MKSRVSKFRKVVRDLCREGVDRVRRNRRGYGDEETGDDYHDVTEDLELEDFEVEDIDRLRRAKDGYGDSEFDEGEDPLEDEEEDDEKSFSIVVKKDEASPSPLTAPATMGGKTFGKVGSGVATSLGKAMGGMEKEGSPLASLANMISQQLDMTAGDPRKRREVTDLLTRSLGQSRKPAEMPSLESLEQEACGKKK